MIHIASSTFIYRSLKTVFDFISTSSNDFEWQYGTLASGQVSEGANGVGTAFRTVGHLMGRRTDSTFEITEYEAGRRYGFKSVSGPLHSHTLYSLEHADGATQVKVSTEASPADAVRVQESVLKKHMQKQLNDDLNLLKTILEGGSSIGLQQYRQPIGQAAE